MSVYKKLMHIQNNLKAPKNQYNNFGKYSYRSCEDILEAVKPLMIEEKATLTITDEVIQIGERIYVKATVNFIDTEEEKIISVTAYAREEENKKGMDGSQITGASSSYARKYALNGLFCIDDTKDSDGTNKHGKDNKSQDNKKTNITLTDAQIKRLYALGYSAGFDATTVKEQIKTKFKCEPNGMTKKQYDTVCNSYEKVKKN